MIDKKLIEDIIKPETDLELKILNDEELLKGLSWGKPRNGHPEGKVIYHVRDVLRNVDKLSSNENRENLRLIAIIHDSFKYKVDRDKPKSGDNHHAMIARNFASKYIKGENVLDIIELHDEAYNSWRKGNLKGKWEYARERAEKLIKRLSNNLEIYLVFYSGDNESGDKNNEDILWFKKLCEL